MRFIVTSLLFAACCFNLDSTFSPCWAMAEGNRSTDILTEETGEAVGKGMFDNADINYGLFKLCVHGAAFNLSLDSCVDWNSSTVFEDGMPKYFKSPDWLKAVFITATLSLLAAIMASLASALNICAQGDLDAFLFMFLFVAGAVSLSVDFIMATKYDQVLEPLAEEFNEKPPQVIMGWGLLRHAITSNVFILCGLFYQWVRKRT